MKAILKAFRDALVADAGLTVKVAAANIYAGIRDEKTPIPCIDVFTVSMAAIKLHGGKVGGENLATMDLQVSIFAKSEDDAQDISDIILDVLLGDNSTLNTAGVRNVKLESSRSLLESGICHIPMRFTCKFIFTII